MLAFKKKISPRANGLDTKRNRADQKRSPTPKSKQIIHFEVLQNGSYLDAIQKPYGKKSVISIGSKKGSLVLPFYPLAQTIYLAQIDRNGVHLYLDSSWSGFATRKGQPIEFFNVPREDIIITLKPGDFASLGWHDLRVLIKIVPVKKLEKAKLNKSYKGKLSQLIFSSQIEQRIVALSTLLALFLIGCFAGGLLIRKDTRPRTKMDLQPTYNLAFINPNHIVHLPEALQNHLDRSKPLIETMSFYEAISEQLLGLRTLEHPYIFKNTTELYNRLYSEHNFALKEAFNKQRDIEDITLHKEATAIVTIPAIAGETLGGSLIRLTEKIQIMHQTFKETLQMRRKTTEEFNNLTGYNFENYAETLSKNKSDSAISKLAIFKMDTNETIMYKDTQALARKAAAVQERIRKQQEPTINLTAENSAPFSIPIGNDYLSFTPHYHSNVSTKIGHITASTFGGDIKKIREPLIGEINPSLIESTINKYKFELQLCFELALRRNRNLAGQMEYYWRLDSQGQISDLSLIKSTINDHNMGRCISKKIAAWKFPKPKRGSIEITYPFVFRPAKG